MNIELDKNLCIGCGLCEENLPEIFKIGKYTAEIIKSEISEDYRKQIEEIIEDCPAEAIAIS